jgi:dihydroflavonol-4-reductase
MSLKALVTGGTGFIGRRLVDRLLGAGWSVRALVLESERGRLSSRPSLEIVMGDVTKPETFRGTMEDVDAVFHAAALVEAWIRDSADYFRVNVEGTGHMVEEALQAGVPRFLFTSSLSGIGVTPGKPMREDSSPGMVFGAYEESKAAAERLVEKAVRERGLPAITLIPSIVLGPGDTRNAGRFLLSFVRGEFPGTFAENSLLPVVDVEDVARAHVLAYEKGRVGERYIVSGENVTWGDLIRFASEASGTPIPSRHIGGRALRLVSRMGEIRARVTRSPPRMPAWLADFMLTGASMDNAKSIRELGMTYRPIRESIAAAIDWFREEGLFEPSRRPAAPLGGIPVENPASREPMEPDRGASQSRLEPGRERRRPKAPKGPA